MPWSPMYHRTALCAAGSFRLTFLLVSNEFARLGSSDNGCPANIRLSLAIDDVPVSGMRLKDIVKVLQGRNERQRALRVVSSHAMSEFTANAH